MLGKVSLVLCAESSINFRLLQERRFWLQAHHTAITIFYTPLWSFQKL